MELEKIKKEDESIGKYATLKKAKEEAAKETQYTGIKHKAVKSKFYDSKLYKEMQCYTVILK